MPADGNGSRPSFCVFTTLIGNYEALNEQSASTNSTIPFVCLTDDPELRSDSWEIRPVATLFGMDPIRSQRALKLLPFDHLPEFDCSLYIDNSVLLVEPPERLVEQFALDRGIALAQHSFRETVLDEFLEVARLGKDDQSRVFEQLNHYSLECPEVLDEKPLWTGLMLRDHRNPQVRELMNIWHAHVQRYSRRDQLSLNIAFRSTGLDAQLLQIDNNVSSFHSWPHTTSRHGSRRSKIVKMAQVPSAAGDRALELQTQADQKELVAERAMKKAAQKKLVAAQKELVAERAKQRAQVDAILSSTSWSITAPMRAVASYLRRSWKPQLPSQHSTEGTPAPTPKFHVSPSDERGRQLLNRDGDLNPLTLQMWRRLLAECSWTHILDIGANYGEMLLGAQLPENAKILAFEPNPLIAPYLQWNLKQGGVSAEIVRSAVSDHVGEAQLVVDRNWSGLSHLAVESNERNTTQEIIISVPTTTISAVLEDAAAASKMRVLVKIDVEGHEAKVLSGVLEVLEHLGKFAALVEVLHVSPADRAWILEHFDVELLDTSSASSPLVPVVPANAAGLTTALANPQMYSQDVVLRRKSRSRAG